MTDGERSCETWQKILAHTHLPTIDTLRQCHTHSSLRNDGVSQLILVVPLLIYKTNAVNVAAADVKTYLLTATSGGLNQQRRGITDAVVAAYILNATLFVPKLDQKSFWKDSSNFDEIFDADWFISSLSKDVEIIKQLPTKGGKPMSPYTMRVPRKCNAKCYQNHLLFVMRSNVQAVQLTKFDYMLSNKLDSNLQSLGVEQIIMP
ncbi:unnamed protein product [Prunus brigantina]